MSRRALAVLALIVAVSSLAACADAVTAPQQPALAPSAPRQRAIEPTTCRGGFVLSDGRCG